jgi:hypothetical protein
MSVITPFIKPICTPVFELAVRLVTYTQNNQLLDPTTLLRLSTVTVNGRPRAKFVCLRTSGCTLGESPNSLPSKLGTPAIVPIPSNAMQATTVPLRYCLPSSATAISSDGGPDLCRFNQILVTDPSSHENGILSARISTRIKLHISLHPGSSIQFLKLPRTPSVHSEDPTPAPSLRFALELRGSTNGAIIQRVCSRCKDRKDQATWDIVDFRAQSTIVAIENGTVNIEFFIKCYAQDHGMDQNASFE